MNSESRSLPSPTSPMHVSLAGAVSAATPVMDEPPISEQSLPASHPLNASGRNHKSPLQIVDELACSDNRMRAVESMVGNLATMFPDASIRCGVGTNRLKRLFDSRLGWLGPQSSLRVDAESNWQPTRTNDPGINMEPESESQGLVIHLPQPDGDGHCFIWIERARADAAKIAGHVDELEPILPVLGNIFWRRPKIAIPQTLSRIGSRAKRIAVVSAAMVALVAIWPTRYPVSCTAKVEPIDQRLVSAPFEATLLTSHVRPGDSVKQGDALAVLDGRPLRLELESIESELNQASKEHNAALATGRVAEAQQLSLRRRGLQRRVDLIKDRLQRLTLISPIDGVIVSGDLQRIIGASLELGQTIIEIAPLQQMAIEIEIPEHEIGLVRDDSMTRVRIGSLGGPSVRQPLTDLYPSAEIRNDRNVFVGRILVDNAEMRLRPGMRGEATAYGPIRPFVWSWLRGGSERILWWLGY